MVITLLCIDTPYSSILYQFGTLAITQLLDKVRMLLLPFQYIDHEKNYLRMQTGDILCFHELMTYILLNCES